MLEFNLIDQRYLNSVPYYRSSSKPTENKATYKFAVDSEVSKYKRTTLTSLESILRQAKLLHSIRSSGEDEKLIELIDKWETATKEAIGELYNHQTGDGSMKKFVKKLGLNWEDLGFSEPEDEEYESSEHEANDENSNYNNNGENSNYNNNDDHKRIKYDD